MSNYDIPHAMCLMEHSEVKFHAIVDSIECGGESLTNGRHQPSFSFPYRLEVSLCSLRIRSAFPLQLAEIPTFI